MLADVRSLLIRVRLLAVVVALSGFVLADDPLQPPVAARKPKQITLHGETRTDNYFWMREKSDPAVAAYLEAENRYAKAILLPTEKLQEKLYNEMLGRIKQTDLSVPYKEGDYFYYSRTEEGKQYPIHCRKKGRWIRPNR